MPSSRAQVFKDRRLSPLQKRALMRFLKAAAEALEGQGPLKVRRRCCRSACVVLLAGMPALLRAFAGCWRHDDSAIQAACAPRLSLPPQDAFGAQPVGELLTQQGLDAQLRASLLYGVLLGDSPPGPTDGTSGDSTGSSGGGSASGGMPPAAPAAPQEPRMAAAEALARLRLFVDSAGRYGPDTGEARL